MNVLVRQATLIGLRQFIEETYKKINCEVSTFNERGELNAHFLEETSDKVQKITKLSAELAHLEKELNKVFYKVNEENLHG